MNKLFQGLKITFVILTPVFVLLFIGLVMFRQNLVLKSIRSPGTDWEKFQKAVKKIKQEKWQSEEEPPFKFYYHRKVDFERARSFFFPALSEVEKAFSRRFNQPLDIFLLKPSDAEKILGKEKSYVFLKKPFFALLSVDFSKEDVDLLASRLVCYSLSDTDDSYWFREGLARYFAFNVINNKDDAFPLSKASSYYDWRKLEETKDIFCLSENEREEFCQLSANIVSYIVKKVGWEKLPFLVDSLSAGSSGLASISYLTGESAAKLEKEWKEEFFSRENSNLDKKENRGKELSRLAFNFYLITLGAILLGSVLAYYFSYRWRD